MNEFSIQNAIDDAQVRLDDGLLRQLEHAVPGAGWHYNGRACDHCPVFTPARELTGDEKKAIEEAGFAFGRWRGYGIGNVIEGWH